MCLDDDGTIGGLSIYTNDLDAVPLIAPPYFARRWPQHYAERRIWYCGFVATSPTPGRPPRSASSSPRCTSPRRRRTVSSRWTSAAAPTRCGTWPHVVRLMLHRLSGDVKAQRIDEQQYWLYEFPPTAAGT
ncbi:hypothetical protein [Dactylosporangium sp. NPDC048998]|uniref:hypothetical protein n=1 Tax=Dactylosporangium sp. NPDC048998 TaxID=3363976 RepID=UPI00371E7CB7